MGLRNASPFLTPRRATRAAIACACALLFGCTRGDAQGSWQCAPGSESCACVIDDDCAGEVACVAGRCARDQTLLDPPWQDPSQPYRLDAGDKADMGGKEDAGPTCVILPSELMSDPNFCGDCETSCRANQACISGTCRVIEGSRIAVGARHSCLLDRWGGALCWGGDDAQQARSRRGPFGAIAAGEVVSCGLARRGGVIECWGARTQSDAALGAGYTRLAAGSHHICGARESGVIECLDLYAGRPWLSAVIPGVVELRAGGASTCALDKEREVHCWSRGSPSSWGPFNQAMRSIDVHDDLACGATTDRRITCWSLSGAELSPLGRAVVAFSDQNGERGRWESVQVGATHACLFDRGRLMTCIDQDQTIITRGSWRDADLGETHGCWSWSGAECAGANDFGQLIAPTGQADGVWASVAVGERAACAVRERTGAVACWGQDADDLFTPPVRSRGLALAVGSGAACNDAGACWGHSALVDDIRALGISLRRIELADDRACGFNRNSGEPICVALGARLIPIPITPGARVIKVTAGDGFWCSLDDRGALACEGAISVDPPSQQDFYELSAGGRTACALSRSLGLVCWGEHAKVIALGNDESLDRLECGAAGCCAIDGQDDLRCWSHGDAPLLAEIPPRRDDAIARDLSVGRAMACVIWTHGVLECWSKRGRMRVPE